jgi:hypothetical protein
MPQHADINGVTESSRQEVSRLRTERAGKVPATDKHGCHNREFAEGYFSPRRVYRADGNFDMTTNFIQHRMSTDCGYDKSLTDALCEGCKYRGNGEGRYEEGRK